MPLWGDEKAEPRRFRDLSMGIFCGDKAVSLTHEAWAGEGLSPSLALDLEALVLPTQQLAGRCYGATSLVWALVL